jgi:RNA polymerase sigma factor (sigma-70 family)
MENKAIISDESLMIKYVAGDYQAFERLYQRHSKKIYGYILMKIKNPEESQEIFQTTFRKLHGSLDKYKPGMPFLPWIFTICKHTLIDNRRKAQNITTYQFNVDDIDSFGSETPKFEKDSLSNVEGYDQLKAKEKEILNLKFSKDYDFDQIALELGYTALNARKLSSRAITKLRNFTKKSTENE